MCDPRAEQNIDRICLFYFLIFSSYWQYFIAWAYVKTVRLQFAVYHKIH